MTCICLRLKNCAQKINPDPLCLLYTMPDPGLETVYHCSVPLKYILELECSHATRNLINWNQIVTEFLYYIT